MKNLYFDHSATSPLRPEAKDAMLEILEGSARGEYGNAAALHSPGHRAKQVLEAARFEVARLIGAEPEEIIFTSGGTESNNTVTNIFSGKPIAVSAIEHPSVIESARAHASDLDLIPVDRYGFVSASDVPQAALVSVMTASNELGTIEPISEIAARCRAHGARLHSDATQAFGKIHLNVNDLGVDYLTISAHKIGGPVGIGALYVKTGSPYRPLLLGGHQESSRRAGSSNILLAAGFGAAAKWCFEHWSCKKYAKIASLRDELKRRILAEIPHSSCNSPVENCLPNLLNMSFQAAEGESIQLYLDLANISVSTGSACAAGDLQPSHVLMATRHDAEIAHSSIRFSLGLDATSADIDHILATLPGIITKLQGISTIKIKEQPTNAK